MLRHELHFDSVHSQCLGICWLLKRFAGESDTDGRSKRYRARSLNRLGDHLPPKSWAYALVKIYNGRPATRIRCKRRKFTLKESSLKGAAVRQNSRTVEDAVAETISLRSKTQTYLRSRSPQRIKIEIARLFLGLLLEYGTVLRHKDLKVCLIGARV